VTITEEQVRYIAGLANLNLAPEEIARFARDLGNILTYMDKLNELDTSGVEPMSHVLFETGETATLREDEPGRSLSNDDALGNAPLAAAGYFKVPLVIDK
jgi:aspartyl-tRNA(Asn)/glutamyl-tRNA(Gln) amidotransferase subunit C